MKNLSILFIALLLLSCAESQKSTLSPYQKELITNEIQELINDGVEATTTKDIERYMSLLPADLVIYDESGEIISREQQREYALRDWAIIDTTLNNWMKIDSIQFHSSDSLHVFTSQRWERIMFRRDGVTTDTVITTQGHREIWKKNEKGWFGYDILELGGRIWINGEPYNPN